VVLSITKVQDCTKPISVKSARIDSSFVLRSRFRIINFIAIYNQIVLRDYT
jgi:hypothetical protein